MRGSGRLWWAAALMAVMLGLAACGGDDTGDGSAPRAGDGGTGNEIPEVVDATLTPDADGTYLVAVTISSPYDRPDRYADAWRVSGPDGTVYGLRELTHDHADEQPFTRTLSGVAIPADVASVTVEARDLVGGWSGQTLSVDVPS